MQKYFQRAKSSVNWRGKKFKDHSYRAVSIELNNLFLDSQLPLLTGVCLIQNESGGDTMKVTNGTSSNRYGLFQISNRGGCGKGYLGGACNMRCECKLLPLHSKIDYICCLICMVSALLTDGKLDDNVSCAMKVFSLNGFKDWKGWVNKCKKQALPNVSNCRV